MKKTLAMLLALVMMVFAIAACGGGSDEDATDEPAEETEAAAEDEEADAEDEEADAEEADAEEADGEEADAEEADGEEADIDGSGYTIGVILKTLSSEYWQNVATGIEAAEDEYGVTIQLQGPPSETSYDQQLQMIETAISSGEVDALVIAPLQPDMVAQAIEGVDMPVIALDTSVEAPEILTFVGTGNENAAYEGAKYLTDQLEEGDKVAIISGVQGDPTAMARINGYTKAIDEAGLDLGERILYADAVADKAVDAMQSILQTTPDIKAVFCNNDEMAIAAQRAAIQAGNTDVKVLGFDGNKSAIEAILAGDLSVSIAQATYDMGLMAVGKAVEALNGAELEDFYDSGSFIINPDNAQEKLDALGE